MIIGAKRIIPDKLANQVVVTVSYDSASVKLNRDMLNVAINSKNEWSKTLLQPDCGRR